MSKKDDDPKNNGSDITKKLVEEDLLKDRQEDPPDKSWGMDLLMNYGWALIVLLVAIGALAFFGVLTPESFEHPHKNMREQCENLGLRLWSYEPRENGFYFECTPRVPIEFEEDHAITYADNVEKLNYVIRE